MGLCFHHSLLIFMLWYATAENETKTCKFIRLWLLGLRSFFRGRTRRATTFEVIDKMSLSAHYSTFYPSYHLSWVIKCLVYMLFVFDNSYVDVLVLFLTLPFPFHQKTLTSKKIHQCTHIRVTIPSTYTEKKNVFHSQSFLISFRPWPDATIFVKGVQKKVFPVSDVSRGISDDCVKVGECWRLMACKCQNWLDY